MLVFEYPTLNGGERSLLAVLPHLVGMGYEFLALAPAAGPIVTALNAIGVATIAFDLRDADGRRRPAEGILEDLHTAIRRVHPDRVHGNSLSMGRLTGTVAAQLPVVCTAHLRDIVGLSASAVVQLNANRTLVAVSNAVRDFHAAQGVEPARLRVIYNGIDPNPIPHGRRCGWLKAEIAAGPDAFLIATVGQICLRKGQDVFARAAVSAAEQMPNAHFLLVGKRYSGKPESLTYDEAIDREFMAAGLADRFHRLGDRSDVEQLLKETDLVVHSARQEPFGRVLLEAAATGRPIVATNVGGTAEMLVDGQSALLVPPDELHALAAAMVRAYGDKALRDRLARAAKERVAALFTVEKAARGLADLWRHG